MQHDDVTMSSSTRIIQDMEEEVSGLADPLEVSCFYRHTLSLLGIGFPVATEK